MAPNRGLVIQGYFLPGGPRGHARPVPVPPPARVAQPHRADLRAGMPPSAPRPPAGPALQPQRSGPATRLPAGAVVLGNAPGQRLPAVVQQTMEAFFNTSFADVRVHVGPEAASIGALAFTTGSHLYFAPGQYSPATRHGQKLLAHELTHVVQQRAGRVRNPFGSDVAVVQDLCLEAEAERMANRLAIQLKPVPLKPTPPVHGGGSRATTVRVARLPARVPVRGAAIQPCGCWDGIRALFSRLFSSGSSSQGSYVQLPVFGDGELDEIRSTITQSNKTREEEADWLRDTTCSTSAHRVFDSLGQVTTLSQGNGQRSLSTYMQGPGSRVDGGVVIQVKLGQIGFSQHEFTIVQKGSECYLIQAWLEKISLQQGLEMAERKGVSTLLGELAALEETLTSGTLEERRVALERTFGVSFSEKEWGLDKGKWSYGVVLSWEARARR